MLEIFISKLYIHVCTGIHKKKYVKLMITLTKFMVIEISLFKIWKYNFTLGNNPLWKNAFSTCKCKKKKNSFLCLKGIVMYCWFFVHAGITCIFTKDFPEMLIAPFQIFTKISFGHHFVSISYFDLTIVMHAYYILAS